MARTIVLLSDFKSGSTAMLGVFRKHSEVRMPHEKHFRHIEYGSSNKWEMHYWDLAAAAINGHPRELIKRLSISNSYLKAKLHKMLPLDKEGVFRLWDEIARKHGKIVFEKSPQYLESMDGLLLLEEYAKTRDVRFISLIRNPTDCISSKTISWGKKINKAWKPNNSDGFKYFERMWNYKYQNLEILRSRNKMLHLCYEHFSKNPYLYLPKICKFCGIQLERNTVSHILPVHINYYRRLVKDVWEPDKHTLDLYRKMAI